MIESLRFPGVCSLAVTLLTVGVGYVLSDPDAAVKPHFEGSPARIVRTPSREWVLEADLAFLDSTGKRWRAPAGTLTDGASIPQAFLSITGSPTDEAFLDAAVVHDAYCDRRNEGGAAYRTESWQAVHTMFYEALLAGGTTPATAKIMYAAVWLGGPRWDDPARSLDAVPEEALVREYRECVEWIESKNPDREAIDVWMVKREAKLLAEANGDAS